MRDTEETLSRTFRRNPHHGNLGLGFLGQLILLFKLHRKLQCCCYCSPCKLMQTLGRVKWHSSHYFSNVFSFILIKVQPSLFMLWKYTSRNSPPPYHSPTLQIPPWMRKQAKGWRAVCAYTCSFSLRNPKECTSCTKELKKENPIENKRSLLLLQGLATPLQYQTWKLSSNYAVQANAVYSAAGDRQRDIAVFWVIGWVCAACI